MTLTELQSRLDGLADEFALKLLDLTTAEKIDAWEQWRDAFQLAMKYPDNQQARDCADAALKQIWT